MDIKTAIIGLVALVLLNAIAWLYDAEWINVAVALDIAVVGAYLGVGISQRNDASQPSQPAPNPS